MLNKILNPKLPIVRQNEHLAQLFLSHCEKSECVLEENNLSSVHGTPFVSIPNDCRQKECSSIDDDAPVNDDVLAAKFKCQGNDYFKQNCYEEAIKCYTKAIAACQTENTSELSVYHQNRGAAYEQLKKWSHS